MRRLLVLLIAAVLSVGAVGLASAVNESENVTAPEDGIEAEPIAEPENGNESENVTPPIPAFSFARLSSSITQQPNSTAPVPVVMDQTDAAFGVMLDEENITVENDGVYFVVFTPQVGMLNATENVTEPAYVDFWLTVNGVDIPNSNIRWQSTKEDEGHRTVIVGQMVVMLQAEDVLNLRMAVSDPEAGIGIEAVQPEEEPLVPSISLSIFGFGQ
ncbi:hypothetical protein E2N92_03785 [Methanofollis formosanus]|uniref:Uncharacterized protein n=1 Tax=Methanofollis formosanus TaxID=299308 RepID=A0A8G1A069_9EURY|nr:hypothetical protein [Methanofollis formosanus]QYZ78606.1 hypothetical protein E2N92_03785 [Methanofollis formosanus]